MPGFLFQTGPRYRPVSEPDIMALAGLKEYAVADEHFRPDVWVYFDFLRPTVFYTDVVQLGGETISVEQLEGQGLFATERAVEIVDFYFDIFEKFFRFFGITNILNLFSQQSIPIDSSNTEGKQNFINLVLQHFLSEVSVQRVKEGPSSFNLKFSYPSLERRHSFSLPENPVFSGYDDLLIWNHFFDTTLTGNLSVIDQLIGLHTWCYIYARGTVDRDNYYPIFTGLTTSVTDSDSAGYKQMMVRGLDAVKLLQKSVFRINPGLGDPTAIVGLTGENLSVTAQPLAGATIEEIYRSLILGEEFSGVAGSLVTPPLGVLDYELLGTTEAELESSMTEYVQGRVIPVPSTDIELTQMPEEIRLKHRNQPVMPPKLIVWGRQIDAYRQLLSLRLPQFFASNFMNRFEAVMDVARRTMTEFYADETGAYVSHPYRHAIPFLTSYAVSNGRLIPEDPSASAEERSAYNSVYVISKEAMIDGSFTLSDDELITALIFSGEIPTLGDAVSLANRVGNRELVFSEDLLFRFGCWILEHQEPLVNRGGSNSGSDADNQANFPDMLRLFAYGRLAYNNKDVYQAQCTLSFRPEMVVAKPVWFPERRDIGYIVSVDHSIPIGGFATTGLSISFMRKVDQVPIDLTEFLVQGGGVTGTLQEITPDDIPVLLALFKSAVGLIRTPTLINRLSAPGAVLYNSTLESLIDAQVAETGLSRLELLNRIIQRNLTNQQLPG